MATHRGTFRFYGSRPALDPNGVSTRIEAVESFIGWAKDFVALLDRERGVETSFVALSHGRPVAMDGELGEILANAANGAGLATQHLAIGGGHDTAFVARLCRVGMIFNPCKDGRSHCPEEWTSREQIAKGAVKLLEAVLAIDQKAEVR